MSDKKPVYATYDEKFQTWNVVDLDKNCLFYGNVDGLDKWINRHKSTHVDISGKCLHKIVNGVINDK